VELVSSSLFCLFVLSFFLSFVGYLVSRRRRRKKISSFVVTIVLLLCSFQLIIRFGVFNLYTIKAEIKYLAQSFTGIASIISMGFTNAHNYI